MTRSERLVDRLDGGLLFFPVTPFDAAGRVDLGVYREHLRSRVAVRPAAVFTCCGTGEFFSVDLDEYAACVRVAVEEAAGLPVVAGVGYGTALATRFAERAVAAGADAVLAMPPYLVQPDQRGLLRHYTRLAEDAGADLILYQRDNAIFTPDSVAELAGHPRIVGLKDGHGDLALLAELMDAARGVVDGRMLFLNGMPTAEVFAPGFHALGVTSYSSAVFCFAPQVAQAFHRALRDGDEDTVGRLLDGFYRPLVELRDEGAGYAVSLIKAAVRLTGTPVGSVRPPLSDPTAEHEARLAELVEQGDAIAGEV